VLFNKLIERGVSATAIDALGRAPLHYACKKVSTNLVPVLQQRKDADVNQVDKRGNTPLVYLLEGENHSNTDAITLATQLLTAGANPNVQYVDSTYNEQLKQQKGKVSLNNIFVCNLWVLTLPFVFV